MTDASPKDGGNEDVGKLARQRLSKFRFQVPKERAAEREASKNAFSVSADAATNTKTKTIASSYSMSALLGVAFGLLPCPSAIAAYFAGVSSGSAVAAYAVIALFAAGIASSLTLVGLLLQLFGERWFRGTGKLHRLPWPYIRAGLILAIGLFYVSRLTLA